MLTAKQEAFAQLLADKSNPISQSEAYRKAYPDTNMSDNTIYQAASRLMSNSKILARINELQAPIAKAITEKAIITAEEILNSLKRIAMKAEAAEKYGDATRATELLGKTLAMFIDKKEVSGNLTIESLTDDEIDARLQSLISSEAVKEKRTSH